MPKRVKDPEERELDEYIGQRLRAARESAGLDRPELAGTLGIDKHQIYLIETGNQGVSIKRLFDLCAALGVRPCDLLDEAVSFAPATAE